MWKTKKRGSCIHGCGRTLVEIQGVKECRVQNKKEKECNFDKIKRMNNQ